ncbi:hypothetical protein LX36DRAFT_173983 [Colletotrichum falcatum]|nr:hypothetical protein LX36DRAFT_173983 [Colletotrichum falcatum]
MDAAIGCLESGLMGMGVDMNLKRSHNYGYSRSNAIPRWSRPVIRGGSSIPNAFHPHHGSTAAAEPPIGALYNDGVSRTDFTSRPCTPWLGWGRSVFVRQTKSRSPNRATPPDWAGMSQLHVHTAL